MAEEKVIPTTTIATSNDSEGVVSIYTFYNRNFYDCTLPGSWTDNPLIKESFLSEKYGYKNGILFKEGELLLTAENYPALINFWIDNNGEFHIRADDADSYYIDDNGDLIYELCLDES